MQLGNFSISLSVSDIHASLSFYQKLGFEIMGGDIEENWIILKNSAATVGLFQGMFENNMLTFNPGWDAEGKNLQDFEDVRKLQSKLKESGIELISEADESSSGPASFIVADPDGNPILVDQHR